MSAKRIINALSSSPMQLLQVGSLAAYSLQRASDRELISSLLSGCKREKEDQNDQ